MTATIKEEHDDPDDPEQKPVVSILVYLHLVLSLSFSVVINKCVAHLKNPISHFILSPPYQSIQQCNLIVFFVTCAICILTCLLGEL